MLTPNYTYWFQRYLRRPLTPVESAIITRLERQRSQGGRIRIIIDDPQADTDPTIRNLLTLYLQWLNRRLYPHLTAAVSAPHLPQARRAARTISPDTLYTSGRSADSLRGHSFHLALMLDAHRYPQRDLYHLARNTRIPDSQLPACWQGKPQRDLPPRDSFESVFRTLAAAIPLQSPCNIIILHADLSRARRRSHIRTLHQQTLHGHTAYHLLHLPNKTTTNKTTKSTHKQSIPNSSLLIPDYDTIRDLRSLVGGSTYYLEPPHKKPVKPRPATLRKLLPFHNRPWYIDPQQRPPLHTPSIEHLPSKGSVNKPERGHPALVHKRTNHDPNNLKAPERKSPQSESRQGFNTVAVGKTHDPRPSATRRPCQGSNIIHPQPPPQNRPHPQKFLIPNSCSASVLRTMTSFLITKIPTSAAAAPALLIRQNGGKSTLTFWTILLLCHSKNYDAIAL